MSVSDVQQLAAGRDLTVALLSLDDDKARAAKLFAAARRVSDALAADRPETATVLLEALPNVACGNVIDALLPLLLTTKRRLQLDIVGVTHDATAASFPFYRHALQPALRRLGFDVGFYLSQTGFTSSDNGKISVHVRPVDVASRPALSWVHAGRLVSARCEVVVTPRVPFDVASEQLRALRQQLRTTGWPLPAVTVREAEDATGEGNAVTVRAICTDGEAVFTQVARPGDSPAAVAEAAANRTAGWIDAGVAVQRRLARRLIVPMALACGGRFITVAGSDDRLSQIAEAASRAVGVRCRFIRQDQRMVVQVDTLPGVSTS